MKRSSLKLRILSLYVLGLVIVDQTSHIIRLVHHTTQEYFERTQGVWFLTAQTDLTIVCVAYLSFDVFEGGFCETHEKLEKRLELQPFYDYAETNWGYHARTASVEAERLILSFVNSEAKVSAASQVTFFRFEAESGQMTEHTLQHTLDSVQWLSCCLI
jgi:hypothetical protein